MSPNRRAASNVVPHNTPNFETVSGVQKITNLELTPIRMRRYRGPFRLWGAFCRHQFSADYTISMFEFDFRQGHAHDGMPVSRKSLDFLNLSEF